MGAELGAFGGVEGALEQSAENGRLDVPPVLLGRLVKVLQGDLAQQDGVDGVEQVAVEMGNLI